jgi:hypothetical protein
MAWKTAGVLDQHAEWIPVAPGKARESPKNEGAWMNPGAVLGIRLDAMLLLAVRAFEIVVCGVALGPGQKDTWLCEGGADG